MAKRFLILVLTAIICTQPAHAVWFDSLVNDIPSDKEFVSRPIYNDTDRTNLYTVSAFKIDKPGKDGEHRVNANELELLWAPLKFSISSHGTEYFKLYYRGPKDDVERYYRVIFKESPVRMFPKNDTGHHLHFHLVPKYTDEYEWGGVFAMNPQQKFLSDEEYTALIEEIKKYL